MAVEDVNIGRMWRARKRTFGICYLEDSYEKHWNETMDYKNKPRLNGYENVRISHENNKRQLYN